jgi:hypothetical protein
MVFLAFYVAIFVPFEVSFDMTTGRGYFFK